MAKRRGDVVGDVRAAIDASGELPRRDGDPAVLAQVHGDLADARHKREEARRVEALTLRMAGFSYGQIGERLQITEHSARSLVTSTLDKAANRAVEQLREVENLRLDRVQAAIWMKALDGDLKAVDTFLRISQRRSALNGLDMPTKLNISVEMKAEMEAALIELQRVVLTVEQ